MPATVFPPGQRKEMAGMVVVIGVDPHKASRTAVAIDAAEQPLGQLRVRASAMQAERLLGWARAWPERAWAVEGAGGTGHLLARQLLAAGERVLDVPPELATYPTAPAAAFPAPLPPRASGRPGPGPGAARPRSGARRASSRRQRGSR